MPEARYDAVADWYDAEFATTELGAAARRVVLRLLGEGRGRHAFVHDRDVPELYLGYRDTSYRTKAPGVWSEGLRAKVGARHLPLGLFVQQFLDGGFVLERFEEPEGRDYPHVVALRAHR
jgi:hypothetical protein